MIPLSQLVAVLAALPAALTALAAPATDSPPNALAEPDIMGGTVAKADAVPYAVSITGYGYNKAAWCSGVLLNANTIITTVGCSFNPQGVVKPATWFSVRAGSPAWNTGGIHVAVSRILDYPGFNETSGEGDIALWQLSAPIHQSSTISYVTLPQADTTPAVGSDVLIYGWGDMNITTGEFPVNVHQATVTVPSAADCQRDYDNATITTSMFCVGSKTEGKGACDGDGGGPAVNPKTNVFLGLMSQYPDKAPYCGAPGLYNIYTRVGAYVDWINKNKF